MKPTILLMDNTKEFLDSQARLLELANYIVIPANTIAEAEEKLKSERIHLAIFDLRMEAENDENDRSGLLLAQKPEYRNIPKIILTAYPGYETAVEALGPIEGYRSAIGYVAKDKGIQFLLGKLENTFKNDVKINWDLKIHWSSKQLSSCISLVAIINPTLEDILFVPRAGEAEDLLRKLFYDDLQITISQVIWIKENRILIEIYSYKEDQEEHFWVTIGSANDVRTEQEHYQALSEQQHANIGTSLARYVETLHYAASAWSTPFQVVGHWTRLAQFYRDASDKQIRAVIENLFLSTLANWHSQSHYPAEERNVLCTFREKCGIIPDQLPSDSFDSNLQALLKEALSRNLFEDLVNKENQFELLFPGGKRLIIDDPSPALYANDLLQDKRLLWGSVAGNLDPDTIIIDQEGKTWLTDFLHAGSGPIYPDFISLEYHTRFSLLTGSNLLTLYDFENELISLNGLSDSVPAGHVEPECRKTLSAILNIRRLAAKAGENDLLSYEAGLLIQTMSELMAYDPSRKHNRRELTSLLHHLMFAGLLYEKIKNGNRLQAPKPSLGNQPDLSINTGKHEVLIDGQQVDLTQTEFNLLVYLYNNAGQLCTRAKIMSEVFDYTDEVTDSEKNRLNTQIGRLRQKIEADTSHPKYILTVRDEGYKFVLPE